MKEQMRTQPAFKEQMKKITRNIGGRVDKGAKKHIQEEDIIHRLTLRALPSKGYYDR